MAYKSQEYYNTRMQAECEARGDSEVVSLASGSASKSIYKILHSCGGEYEVRYSQFTSSNKSGCPHCRRSKWAKSFFLTVAKDKPACLYAVSSAHGAYLKVGVSTWDLQQRLIRIKAATPFAISADIQLLASGSASEVVELEQRVKSASKSAGFSGFSGATEWLLAESLDKILLDR